ncbi:thioesterase II family protein [Actinophytocola sp.]|jgi:surfactin synthase thioesterase subunit|uniref:thioesterase II family protein n=1 Tax=Actinophytocola sp. TaxID=1872138 RepID=UPI0039C88D67
MPVRTADTSTAWLRRYQPTTNAVARLVCLPHAGGAASFFRPMAVRFAPAVDVLSIQYPGRQDRLRESCVDDIAALSDLITDELVALDDDLPTVFFGHSMGAVLGFEVAWRLEQKGANPPRTLIASGRRAPSRHRDEKVHLRDDDGIVAELKLLNGTDAARLADEEIVRMSLPAIRGDYTAIETYIGDPGRRVGAGLTVLTGDSDPKTTLDEARAWRDHTTGTFRMSVLPGGHFFLVDQQQAVTREVAAELRL